MTLYIFRNPELTACSPDKHPNCRHPHAFWTSGGIRIASDNPQHILVRGTTPVPAPSGMLVDLRRRVDGVERQELTRVP